MRGIRLLVLTGALLVLSGCSTVIIEGSGNEDAITSPPETIHGSMYGFDWSGKKNVLLAKDKNGKQYPIYSVECHTNYLYLLTGVLTLGFYYPQTFEYTLVKPEKIDDENEKSFDPFKKKKLSPVGGK